MRWRLENEREVVFFPQGPNRIDGSVKVYYPSFGNEPLPLWRTRFASQVREFERSLEDARIAQIEAIGWQKVADWVGNGDFESWRAVEFVRPGYSRVPYLFPVS